MARLTADEQTGGSALLLGGVAIGAQRIATAARDARTPLVSKADDTIAQEARNAASSGRCRRRCSVNIRRTASRGRATWARRRRARRRVRRRSRWLRRRDATCCTAAHGSDLPDDATTSSMMPSLKQARRDVREGLAALPAPKFAYDVDVPDAIPEDAPVAMELEPDARAVDEARAEACGRRNSLN